MRQGCSYTASGPGFLISARSCPSCFGLLCSLSKTGYEYLTRLIVHSDDRLAILTACRNQYYSLSAAGALFHWLEQAQGLAFAPRTLRIEYEAPEGTCLIDADSAANLELVSNVRSRMAFSFS